MVREYSERYSHTDGLGHKSSGNMESTEIYCKLGSNLILMKKSTIKCSSFNPKPEEVKL